MRQRRLPVGTASHGGRGPGLSPDLASLYPLQWFRNRTKSARGPHKSSRYLADLIYGEFSPRRVIDLGAGTCAFANRIAELGGKVVAVEGSEFCQEFAIPPTRFIAHDLCQPLLLRGRFDLVTSWDVIEHIPAVAEATVVETIVRLAGKWVVVSIDASRWGRHHVNCHSKGYWRERFENAGLRYSLEKTRGLAQKILAHPLITSKWYGRNLLVFEASL